MALKLGIISTARIDEMILRAAKMTDGLDVVAVASRDRERAHTFARAHGIARAFGSYDELLSSPDLDAVCISLPNSMHVDWSVRSIQAGKHVLCEKPLARDPVAAARAVGAVAQAGRVLMEGFMYRHNPQTTRLLELVKEGAIGRTQFVRTCLRYPVSDTADIRLNLSLDGGSLMDLGCYCVHVARSLAGEPDRVYAEQVLGVTGVEVALQGTLHFSDGVVAQFDSSFVAERRQDLELVGDQGRLRLAAPFRVDWGRPGIELARGGKAELIEIDEQDSYALELENFVDAVLGGEQLLPAADSVGQARTIAALHESAERCAPITV
jgi:D-xylose 1-dehydrogenase (NADP+, D-xylono-1,5-lactone-forming)